MVQCKRGTFDEAGKLLTSHLLLPGPRAASRSLLCLAAITNAGGRILEDNAGIELKGWRIESCKAPISSKFPFSHRGFQYIMHSEVHEVGVLLTVRNKIH